MRDLNPTAARLFVQPLQPTPSAGAPSSWRRFASGAPNDPNAIIPTEAPASQFGVAFGGATVESQDAWLAAVAEVRAVSKAPGDPDFLAWLPSHTPVAWKVLLAQLKATVRSSSLYQVGDVAQSIRDLLAQRYSVLAVWDVRCRNLAYTTTDPADPEYWKERWETYRLFYLGGRWLARRGVIAVELYNEPDKDGECLDGPRWVDDVRIRAQAMRDAYADYNSLTGDSLAPNLMAPTTANPWSDAFS
jgi:hypothetical protein